MARPVLDIDHVGKVYRLGQVGSGTLSEDLQWAWARFRGKKGMAPAGLEAPGGVREGSPAPTPGGSPGRYVKALDAVTLQVKQDEVLGLIGKNGAGKSTLLKLLSRVTAPSSGRIRVKGTIASLLEVGTGMHPELTGRENVFLNGAILGMDKAEIAAKFDDIVAFSGCATYIDTPVKRYSSGMKVRLGFAVAAFLEPDILIVDEVLAVGDAAFQKQAIDRMQEVSRSGDRTVIFVSHNMTSVRSLCTRAVWLDGGRVAYDGDVETAIARYLGYQQGTTHRLRTWPAHEAPGTGEVRLRRAALVAGTKTMEAPLSTDDALRLEVEAECLGSEKVIDCSLQIYSDGGTFLASTGSIYFMEGSPAPTPAGHSTTFICHIPAHFFNQGVYRFTILLLTDRRRRALRVDDLFRITFAAAPRHASVWHGTPRSLTLPGWKWETKGG